MDILEEDINKNKNGKINYKFERKIEDKHKS